MLTVTAFQADPINIAPYRAAMFNLYTLIQPRASPELSYSVEEPGQARGSLSLTRTLIKSNQLTEFLKYPGFKLSAGCIRIIRGN